MSQRPIRGESWTPDATEHRRFQRVTDEFDRALMRLGAQPLNIRLGPGVCQVKNGSGNTVDRFGILGIDDAWLTPTDSESRFCAMLPMTGNAPLISEHDGKFVVLMEPARENQLVWAVNAGVVAAQIQVTAGLEWYGYADVTNSNTAVLTLLPAGAAQVLWKEDSNTNTTVFAIVRIGLPSETAVARIKFDEALNAASTATASVWDGDPLADTGHNLTVCDGDANWSLMSSGSFDANTTGVAQWCRGSRTWQLTAAACTNSS